MVGGKCKDEHRFVGRVEGESTCRQGGAAPRFMTWNEVGRSPVGWRFKCGRKKCGREFYGMFESSRRRANKWSIKISDL